MGGVIVTLVEDMLKWSNRVVGSIGELRNVHRI